MYTHDQGYSTPVPPGDPFLGSSPETKAVTENCTQFFVLLVILIDASKTEYWCNHIMNINKLPAMNCAPQKAGKIDRKTSTWS